MITRKAILASAIVLASTSLSAEVMDYDAYETKWKPITCSTYESLELGMNKQDVMDKLNQVYTTEEFISDIETMDAQNEGMGAGEKITFRDKQMPESFMFIVGFDSESKLNFMNIGYYCKE